MWQPEDEEDNEEEAEFRHFIGYVRGLFVHRCALTPTHSKRFPPPQVPIMLHSKFCFLDKHQENPNIPSLPAVGECEFDNVRFVVP